MTTTTRPGPRVGMLVHRHDDRAVSRTIAALCKSMTALGAHPVLLRVQAGPRTTDVGAGVQVVDIGADRKRTATSIPALGRYLRTSALDVVFAHLNGPGRAALIARALGRVDIGVVPVEHVHYTTFYRHRHMFQDVLTRTLYPRADRVAGVSPGVVDELVRLFPRVADKSIVLPSIGPTLDAVASAKRQRISHPWFSRQREHQILVCVANVLPRKGQDVLVRALPFIREACGDVRLVLIGRPDDQAYARQLEEAAAALGVGEQVRLTGYLPDPLPYIAQSDALLLASETEGCPMVLVEAMACGRPVVATDCPVGPRFLLSDGRYGQLVPVGDVNAMAAAVIDALCSEHWRGTVARAAQTHAGTFSPQSVASQYLSVADRVMQDRWGSPAIAVRR